MRKNHKGKYRDVILPMTILRRIDVILDPTKQKVLKTYNTYKGKGTSENYVERVQEYFNVFKIKL